MKRNKSFAFGKGSASKRLGSGSIDSLAESRAPDAVPTARDQLPSSGFVEISVAQKPFEPVRVVFNGVHIECANRDQVGLTVEIIRGLTDGR